MPATEFASFLDACDGAARTSSRGSLPREPCELLLAKLGFQVVCALFAALLVKF